MAKYLDDALIVTGCGLIVYATCRLSMIAALFVGGFMLIAAGILVGMTTKRGEK
jgi:hypothetical protein